MQSKFKFSIFDVGHSGRMLAVLSFLTAFTSIASAANPDPFPVNQSQLYYTIPGNPPPQSLDTIIDNEGTYSVTFNTWINNQVEFCEPWWNTKFFTNNGAMMVNAPIPTNGDFNFSSSGVGFEFDTQAGNSNVMADTFYNSGSIHCDSILDGNNGFDFGDFFSFFFQTSIGECVVSATNIINPGQVIVSANGLMSFTGQNVDLSSSTLAMDGVSANVLGTGTFGRYTNWDPSLNLGSTFADSAFFPIAPFFLDLNNSTPFIDIDQLDASNVLIRAVFVQDTSGPNVSYNAYIRALQGLHVGVEWTGTYVDAATGVQSTNYLLLDDDVATGASTNVALVNGYPDNFTFIESSTPLVIGNPASPGFTNAFPAGGITNRYAFANVQLVSSTTATNASSQNPSGALTNLPGRLYINAGRDLDLRGAAIAGPNYTSIQSPNQFEGSAGAQIITPYADINVGVTNGFLTVSNLMQPQIPNWGGAVQAWTTRFIFVDSNGVTNDYRVLIVGSQLNTSTPAYVQDLILHGTNSLVLADNFNVLRKLFIDSQNLTVTTNGPGNGATSTDGELNLFPSITWSTAVPNLKNLTNNGVIRIASGNLAQFGSDTTTYVTNITPAVLQAQASGILSELSGTNVAVNSQITIGTNTYAFVSSIQVVKIGKQYAQTPNQIKIAPTFDGTMSNLMLAINHWSGDGVSGTNTFSTNTVVNQRFQVYPKALSNHTFVVVADMSGSSGNSIVTTTTSTNLTWSGGTLFGGVDAVVASTNVTVIPPQHYGALINNSWISDQGADVWVDNFVSFGTFSNGIGSFTLHSLTAALTGQLTAGGSVSLTAQTLVMTNLALQANRSLTLTATNLLTDGGSTNNFWTVGTNATALTGGINLPIKPTFGDLLGTTITNYAPQNVNVSQIWAGQDRGVSVTGFTNNEAIGHLILDALPSPNNPLVTSQNGKFTFNGATAGSALYVDYLELRDAATNTDTGNNFIALNINTNNMVIYYAEAVMNGSSIASKMNGKNNNRLRWVPQYAGLFSSVQIVSGGTTNSFNSALAASALDSDGDGIRNDSDPTPFFLSSMVNLVVYPTNNPANTMAISWNTIPLATNCVFYSTNLMTWQLLTNFISPQPNPGPATNVIIFDPCIIPGRYYQVMVKPWLTNPF